MNFDRLGKNAAGSFHLTFDGGQTSIYVRSVEGGFAKAAPVEEPLGPVNQRLKHTAVVELEPFSFEVGMAGARDVLTWIRNSWRAEPARKNGQISHGDFNRMGIGAQAFEDALITEATFPALNAAGGSGGGGSTEAAYLKVKVMPERIRYETYNQRLDGVFEQNQKAWSTGAFRLIIDGIETKGVQRIESFTVKQTVKRLYTGAQRLPELVPTKIEFPNLSATIAEANAAALLKWHQAAIVRGEADALRPRTGAIEYLGADKQTVLMRISLSEVGLISASFVAAQANQAAVKMLKFELYVGGMDIDLASASGLG